MQPDRQTPTIKMMQPLLAFLCIWVSFSLWAQEPTPENNDALSQAHKKNWYNIEIVIFSRPLEDAVVSSLQNQDNEVLALEKRPSFDAHIKTLLPVQGAVHAPQKIEQLTSLMNSIYYTPIVQLASSGSTPELEDVIAWISNITVRHKSSRDLRSLSNLTYAHQYWPYIRPLFPEISKRPSKPIIPSDPSTLTEQAIEDETSIPGYLSFKVRAKESFQLLETAKAIQKEENFNLLWHQSWQQPIPPRGKGIPVLIQGQHALSNATEQPFSSLDGTVTVELGRFLHSRILLWARPPKPQDSRAKKIKGYLKFDETVRSKRHELHYLDHPYFGVLLLITPYERDPSEDLEREAVNF